jgi:hypothetical protein
MWGMFAPIILCTYVHKSETADKRMLKSKSRRGNVAVLRGDRSTSQIKSKHSLLLYCALQADLDAGGTAMAWRLIAQTRRVKA